MEELGHLAEAHVALGPAAEVGHQLAEGEGTAVVGLEGLAQDDGVDRGESQVGEEPGLGADRPRVVAAVEAGEDLPQVGQDPLRTHREIRIHQSILSARVQAQTYSPRRAVTARIGRSRGSGQASASSGPSATETAPLVASTPTTSTEFGPPTSPRPVALATASLAHQSRATHSARAGPASASRSSQARSPWAKARRSNSGERSVIGSTSIPTRASGSGEAIATATPLVCAIEIAGRSARPGSTSERIRGRPRSSGSIRKSAG